MTGLFIKCYNFKFMDRKEVLVNNLKNVITSTRSALDSEIAHLVEMESNLLLQVRKAFNIDQEIAAQQLTYTRRRIEELKILKRSPFFAKVTYLFDNNRREVFISKFEFDSASDITVASWTAPVSELRFEDLGKAILRLPERKTKEVDLFQKDSYVIGEEKVVYYSQETEEFGIEIIYEDFLSTVKSEFGLSEIVAKIEKEQYQIIQSDPKTALIISGPAGSGKTTICLHRVAYLIQRPETSELYEGKKLLMLVQDTSTKNYFSSILPKLGIPNMLVDTYFDFGLQLLQLENFYEISLFNTDYDYLDYVEEKLKLLDKQVIKRKKTLKNALEELEALYKKHLQKEHFERFLRARLKHTLDYLDVTIMLMMIQNEEGRLCLQYEYYKSLGNGKYKKLIRTSEVLYGMVIIDEFQNYSHDQIALIKNLVDRTHSLVYVGDVNQKSILRPSSKRYSYDFSDCKKVELNKVYRNTKQILSYIKSLGYAVEVPDTIREGEEVRTFLVSDVPTLVEMVQSIITGLGVEETVGVLCDSDHVKNILNSALSENMINRPSMKVMTKTESQGTEFNSVICVNGNRVVQQNDKFSKLLETTARNMHYIGYTRAVEKLFVFECAEGGF